ncbi:MAG: hypothetical protein KF685_13110 [Acidobacteria bacterium]|nr:hypothetical protein [Acidobacteriota bacterium]
MKRISLFLILVTLTSGVVYSQTVGMALEQAKGIKLLETERSAVAQVLYFFKLDTAFDNTDLFSWGDIDLSVQYSTGECD